MHIQNSILQKEFFQQQSLIGNVDIDLKNWSPLDSSIFVIDREDLKIESPQKFG